MRSDGNQGDVGARVTDAMIVALVLLVLVLFVASFQVCRLLSGTVGCFATKVPSEMGVTPAVAYTAS